MSKSNLGEKEPGLAGASVSAVCQVIYMVYKHADDKGEPYKHNTTVQTIMYALASSLRCHSAAPSVHRAAQPRLRHVRRPRLAPGRAWGPPASARPASYATDAAHIKKMGPDTLSWVPSAPPISTIEGAFA